MSAQTTARNNRTAKLLTLGGLGALGVCVLIAFDQSPSSGPSQAPQADVATEAITKTEKKLSGYPTYKVIRAKPTTSADGIDPEATEEDLVYAFHAADNDRPEVARYALEKIIAADPQNLTALTELGYLVLEQQGEQSLEAAGFFAKALAVDPNQEHLIAEIIDIHAAAGNPDEAMNVLSNLAAKHPDSYAVRESLGREYAKRGQFEAAVDYFESALHGNPAPEIAAEMMADALADSGDSAMAAEAYSDAAYLEQQSAAKALVDGIKTPGLEQRAADLQLKQIAELLKAGRGDEARSLWTIVSSKADSEDPLYLEISRSLAN